MRFAHFPSLCSTVSHFPVCAYLGLVYFPPPVKQNVKFLLYGQVRDAFMALFGEKKQKNIKDAAASVFTRCTKPPISVVIVQSD